MGLIKTGAADLVACGLQPGLDHAEPLEWDVLEIVCTHIHLSGSCSRADGRPQPWRQ